MLIQRPLQKLVFFGLLLILIAKQSIPNACAYDITNRWTNTKTDGGGNSRGDALTLLWSVVPDGEGWSRGGPSDLIDYLDVGWNVAAANRVPDLTNRPWWAMMDRVYEQYERVSGLTLTYEPEQNPDGSDTGVSGDLRIGGVPFTWENDKGGVLADNSFPNNGDMRIDTYRGNNGVPSFWHTNNNAFRNLISHESGHGVGLSHSDISGANSVMETPLESNFWGLQFDDVYAFNRLYGDPLEKNGGNDDYMTAYDFARVDPGNSVVLGLDASGSSVNEMDDDWVGIDGNSDEDWFTFFVTETAQIDVTVSPMGPSYTTNEQGDFDAKERADLNFQIVGTDGSSVLTTVDATDIGQVEQLSNFTLPSPGRYYIRVDGEADQNQFYQLDLAVSINTPTDLTWVGRFGNSWDNQVTNNFSADGSFVGFGSFDNVTFDDTAVEAFVIISEDVTPGDVLVDTSAGYFFAGDGGITAGTLVKTGTGTLELLNAGNSYAGPTMVNEGTLVVTTQTGAGNTMVAVGAALTGDGLVQGDLETAGILKPGAAIGTLTVGGNASLEATSLVEMEIGAGANDLLDVGGILNLAGELQVSLLDGLVPTAGESFDLFDFASAFGNFDSFDLPMLAVGLFWDTSALATTGELSVATGLQGDFDLDNDVDGDDFLIWQRGSGTLAEASVTDGDADLDGDVDSDDLAIWQANYGLVVGASVAAVPEPSSIVLLLIGIIALMRFDKGCQHER